MDTRRSLPFLYPEILLVGQRHAFAGSITWALKRNPSYAQFLRLIARDIGAYTPAPCRSVVDQDGSPFASTHKTSINAGHRDVRE
jgi:hypothetical protein